MTLHDNFFLKMLYHWICTVKYSVDFPVTSVSVLAFLPTDFKSWWFHATFLILHFTLNDLIYFHSFSCYKDADVADMGFFFFFSEVWASSAKVSPGVSFQVPSYISDSFLFWRKD